LEKKQVPASEVPSHVGALLEEIDKNISEKSWRTLRQMIVDAQSVDDVKRAVSERYIARINWCGDEECAMQLKEAAGGELRGSKFEEPEAPFGGCVVCQRPAKDVVYVARAY
jgi:prolyl-tRNA synthetase